MVGPAPVHRHEQPVNFNRQDFDTIYKKCKKQGTVFEDDEFKRSDQIFDLSYVPSLKQADITWKRAHEISNNPVLFSPSKSKKIQQVGILSNPMLINAFLVMRTELVPRIIPSIESEIWPDDYYGVFKFRFWRLNEWVEVVVDDFLPVDVNNKRLFSHVETQPNEFALSLAEKALAKFYGGYKMLQWQRNLGEMLEDLTGGVPERISLSRFRPDVKRKDYPNIDDLFYNLYCNVSNKDPMGCGISAQIKEITEIGLAAIPSMYTVSGIRRITELSENCDALTINQMMIRLRNVWNEGTPGYNEESYPLLRTVENRVKHHLTKSHPNDFWMTIEEFINYFDVIYVCHIVDNLDCTWCERSIRSFWTVLPHRCGALEGPDYLENPQYYFDVSETEIQVHIQMTRESNQYREDGYGMTIIKVESNREHRVSDATAFKNKYHLTVTNCPYVEKYDRTGNMTRTRIVNRSVVVSHYLSKGRYFIVPATIDGGYQDHFNIRVVARNPRTHIYTLEEVKKTDKMFTHIDLIEVSGLDMKDVAANAMLHVVVLCEDNQWAFNRQRDAKLWESAVFRRTTPDTKPVYIKFFTGRNSATHLATFEWSSVTEVLNEKKSLNASEKSGTLSFKVIQSTDFKKM